MTQFSFACLLILHSQFYNHAVLCVVPVPHYLVQEPEAPNAQQRAARKLKLKCYCSCECSLGVVGSLRNHRIAIQYAEISHHDLVLSFMLDGLSGARKRPGVSQQKM